MNRATAFILIFILFMVACQKEPGDNLEPVPASPDTSNIRLKSYTTEFYENSQRYLDSTVISIDHEKNQILLATWSSYSPEDSTKEIFTYNSNNQLIQYDQVYYGYWNLFGISKMRFVRDASGRPIKCYSDYYSNIQNVPPSEGIFTYSQSGDTSFVAFNDSVPKGFEYDAADNYKWAFINNRPVYCRDFGIPGYSYPQLEYFKYDADGNLTEVQTTFKNDTDVYSTVYSRLGRPATELQKFTRRLFGDLYWFYRSKMIYPPFFLVGDYYLEGNVISSIKYPYSGNIVPYKSEFDAEGNVIRVEYQETFPGAGPTIIKFEYWPK